MHMANFGGCRLLLMHFQPVECTRGCSLGTYGYRARVHTVAA